MTENVFLSALQKITAGQCGIADLITAATQLVAVGQGESAEQLYNVWLRCNPGHATAQIAMSGGMHHAGHSPSPPRSRR